jgi:hypothetical protein
MTGRCLYWKANVTVSVAVAVTVLHPVQWWAFWRFQHAHPIVLLLLPSSWNSSPPSSRRLAGAPSHYTQAHFLPSGTWVRTHGPMACEPTSIAMEHQLSIEQVRCGARCPVANGWRLARRGELACPAVVEKGGQGRGGEGRVSVCVCVAASAWEVGCFHCWVRALCARTRTCSGNGPAVCNDQRPVLFFSAVYGRWPHSGCTLTLN